MKKSRFFFFSLTFLLSIITMHAQKYAPYTMGARTHGNIAEVTRQVKAALTGSGFVVLGSYKPANAPGKRVIAITSPQLKAAVRKTGGLRGFALALRVGVTKEKGGVSISYTTPEYWASAYFQKDYPSVKANIANVSAKLAKALAPLGSEGGTPFGISARMSVKDLKGYHYMFGMPYFEDNIVLHTFRNYSEAVQTIDANFKRGKKHLIKVYEVALPGQKIKLYGVGLRGPSGESNFLPTIDFQYPHHTPFLPYEMLVYKNKVYMLHGRYRIALSFPDLSMGTFMKIVSTPGNIETLLKSATE